MKIINKALSLFLCVIMAFSCCILPAGAKNEEETTDFSYSLRYYTDKADSYGVDNILDEIDKLLKEKNYSVSVPVVLTTIKIDLSSINAVCETFDLFKGILSNLAMVAVKRALGDLGELDVSSWKTGMQRGTQDITIVTEFIELLFNNREIIEKFCSGNFDAGALNGVFNIEKLVGEDGISGTVKKLIIGLVYEKDSRAYNEAYETYKNNFDAFIYGDLLSTYADKYLPGFTMNEKSTVEDLICVAFGLVVERYVKPIIAGINIDTANSEYEALRALHGLINLKGSTYDFSKIKFNPYLSFLSQVNGVVGEIFTQLIPGYTWKSGNYDKISENIEGAFKYLGKESGLIENADSLSFDEIVMQVVGIIIKNVDLKGLGDGVTECETLEDMAKVALMNLAGNLGLGTSYKDSDSYLTVLGDIAAHYLYNNFCVTDLNGKTLMPGMGYDIFEVANFALNYLLFDKSLGNFLGFSTTKKTDVFTKVDKLLDYFGETKSKGVAFDSKKFLLGDSKSKGLLDAIFALDIQYILDITAVPALETAGDVSAVKFIYNALRYFLNNWSGKNMIPEYTAGAFNNALTNANVAKLAEYLIETVSVRNTSFIGVAAFIGSIFLGDKGVSLGEVTAKISDAVYSGGAISPKATVSLGGKALTQYKDFVVVCTDTKIGQAKAVIKGTGIYKGTSEEFSFRVSLGQIKNLKATAKGDKIALSWQAIAGAEKYIIESSVYSGSITESNIEIPVKAGGEYTFTVTAVAPDGSKSGSATVTVKAEPGKIKNLRADSVSSGGFCLLWDKVSGADEYSVEIYDSSLKKWKQTATPVVPKAEINRLTAGTEYKLRVCAVFNTAEGEIKGEYAALNVTTSPGKVKNLDVDSVTSSTVKLSWDKVKGVKGYEIYIVASGENSLMGTTTGTSYTVKKLSAGKKYSFKVRAYTADKTYGEFSSAINTATLLPTVTGLKTTKTSASYIKLSWKKVSSADKYMVEIYKGGEWIKYKTVTTNSVTVKSLSSGTVYKFRVRAYDADLKVYSAYSSTHSAKTRVSTVKNLKASAAGTSTVTLKWSKVKGADGYVAYYSTDNKTWKKISSTTKNTITAKSLKGKKTYYFKVRAYSKPSGKALYGPYSSVLKVKTK